MSKMPHNFLLRMGQMMAERQRNMTIVERTARWYRMERVAEEEQTIPCLEERMDKLNEKINSIKIPYDVKLLRGEMAYLRNKVAEITAIRKKKGRFDKYD